MHKGVPLFFVICLCIPCVFCTPGSQLDAQAPFTAKQVGPNVWAAISNPMSPAFAAANMGFVVGEDGVAVVDASVNLDAQFNFGTEPTKQLLATIRTVT